MRMKQYISADLIEFCSRLKDLKNSDTPKSQKLEIKKKHHIWALNIRQKSTEAKPQERSKETQKNKPKKQFQTRENSTTSQTFQKYKQNTFCLALKEYKKKTFLIYFLEKKNENKKKLQAVTSDAIVVGATGNGTCENRGRVYKVLIGKGKQWNAHTDSGGSSTV